MNNSFYFEVKHVSGELYRTYGTTNDLLRLLNALLSKGCSDIEYIIKFTGDHETKPRDVSYLKRYAVLNRYK